MKKLVILLCLCLMPLGVYSAEYDQYVYTPEQGIELISYVALKDNGQVYKNLRDLTLMGIFRQERNFSLANYVTSLDALKIIFRVAGLEDYAYACGEDLSLRAGLGVPEEKEYSVGDGFFIAAYQKGLIDKAKLDGYFYDKPGCRATDYIVRQDIIVWLAKLFEVAPIYNKNNISKYGSISLIAPGNRPYFEGLFEAGISVSDGGSYKPCSLIKNSELVTLITRFYPYLLSANGIETRKDVVFSVSVDGNNQLTVLLEGGDIIKATPDNMCLVVGNDYVDNLYILNTENIKNTPITYYVKSGKIIFVSLNMKKPELSFGTSFSGKLYFYDDLTGAVVLKNEDGKYEEYFLADNVEIIENGEKIPAEKLMKLTDKTFEIHVVAISPLSLKKITKLEYAG